MTSLEVGTVRLDSGDVYECSPSPGQSSQARVHVITEGGYWVAHTKLFNSHSISIIAVVYYCNVCAGTMLTVQNSGPPPCLPCSLSLLPTTLVCLARILL